MAETETHHRQKITNVILMRLMKKKKEEEASVSTANRTKKNLKHLHRKGRARPALSAARRLST